MILEIFLSLALQGDAATSKAVSISTMVLHTYEAKIRLDSKVTTTRV